MRPETGSADPAEAMAEGAFERLVQSVSRGLPTHLDFEGAVQEAVLRAWLESEDGRSMFYPKGWILRTARNLLIDQLRRLQAEERAIRRFIAELPSDSYLALETGLPDWLDRVPERQRQALVLHYVDGLSVEAVAKHMRTSVGTAKSQLHWGRKAVLAILGKDRKETLVANRRAQGWFMAGSKPRDYEASTLSGQDHAGAPVVSLRSKESVSEGFGTLMQTIGADSYRGKRVRFAANVEALGVEGWSGLWMRVDPVGGGRPLAFDNMEDRVIAGDHPWARYEVVLDVAAEADAIAFGVLLSGAGEVRLSGFRFDEVGSDVPVTGEGRPPDRPVNLDLSIPVSA